MRLVIDTATAACSVALLDGDRLVAERHEVVGRGHAERLVPQIAELLGEATAPCTAIHVDCGPGSFTGVRVGLAAARAFGLAWRVPVLGYSAVALIAAAALRDRGVASLCVAVTGGHGELFLRRFSGKPFAALTELESLAPAVAAPLVPEELVVGSGAAALVAARGWGEAAEGLPRAADLPLLPPEWTELPPSPIYGRAPDARLPTPRVA